MRLVTFVADGITQPGILQEKRILPLAALGYSHAIGFIAHGQAARDAVTAKLANSSNGDLLSVEKVRLLAPVQHPSKILCIGLNYRDHAIESKMELPSVPTVFTKFSSAIIGPGDPIVIPRITQKPDYEAEFAVVIGKTARRVARQDWQEYVFGYTILNDVSARDVQLATSQWTLGKSFDSFAPIGPCIVTVDEIPDPHSISIKLSIGGEVLQDSNTRELIFRVPELIEHISSIVTLQPGDIISTGTPSGVGLGRTPQRWLQPGDEVVVDVEGIGSLRNPVIAEA